MKMKKIIVYIIWLIVLINGMLILQTNQVYWADDELESFLSNLFWDLSSDSSWWFQPTDQIVVSNKTDSTVDLTFPIVSDWNEKIDTYNVRWSNVSMNSTEIWDYDSNSIIDQTFSGLDTSKPTATVTLKWLKKWVTYYVTISPINKDWVNWNISKEISFRLDDNNNSSNTTNNTTTNNNSNTTKPQNNNQQHWSAPNMNLANISFSNNWTNVTLTWTPLAWADKLEISYKKISDNNYEVLWKVDMNDWTFKFNVPKIDTYTVKVQPIDDDWNAVGTPFVQTIHMTAWQSTTTTTYPKTWPTENILLILIWSAFVYYFYKLRRKTII